MPVQDRSSALVFGCPVQGCTTQRSNSSGRRGPAEMNRHVRTHHPNHKHLDIVYRACLLEDKPSDPRGFVLTHHERYKSCEGAGVPIDPIHTLEPGFTAAKDHDDGYMPSGPKRRRGQAGKVPVNDHESQAEHHPKAQAEQRTEAEPERPRAESVPPSLPAAEISGDPPTANPPSTGIMTMVGAREVDANIQWALERGHGVEVQAISIKYAPGQPGPPRG